MTDTVRYLENAGGSVHSVNEDTYQRLQVTEDGARYLPRGFKEITAAEAKRKHPQLFGKPDPQITYTDDELVRAARRKKLLAEIHGDTAEVTDEDDTDLSQ